jgi:hypothetical protein
MSIDEVQSDNLPVHLPKPGTRVRIVSSAGCGSAWKLRGLTGTVIEPHPIAPGWVTVGLDPNDRTEYERWPVYVDRLEILDQSDS